MWLELHFVRPAVGKVSIMWGLSHSRSKSLEWARSAFHNEAVLWSLAFKQARTHTHIPTLPPVLSTLKVVFNDQQHTAESKITYSNTLARLGTGHGSEPRTAPGSLLLASFTGACDASFSVICCPLLRECRAGPVPIKCWSWPRVSKPE